MRQRSSADALTDDEIRFLRSERAAPTVRDFVARQHDTIGVRAAAYRKVAAAARAEREAIIEVATLAATRVGDERHRAAEERLVDVERERDSLARELDVTRSRLVSATAEPARAVHAVGSQR